MISKKIYIGDSCYVQLDPAGRIQLTTEDGTGNVGNCIILEEATWAGLFDFACQVWGPNSSGEINVEEIIHGQVYTGMRRPIDSPNLILRIDVTETQGGEGFRLEQIPGAKTEIPEKKAAGVFLGLIEYGYDRLRELSQSKAIANALKTLERMPLDPSQRVEWSDEDAQRLGYLENLGKGMMTEKEYKEWLDLKGRAQSLGFYRPLNEDEDPRN